MKTARLEIRTTVELREAIAAAAKRRGQSLNVFAERAFEAALGGGHTRDAAPDTGPGESTTRVPASASPQAFDRLQASSAGEDPRLGPARPRRADIGPKPAAASKPRPKASTKETKR